MYLPTQNTTNFSQTLSPTPTSPPKPALQNPASPTFGPDTTMNLIFGISAFMMAGITIWQNRSYFRNMSLPFFKTDE